MPLRRDIRHLYATPEWRATSLRIRKERAGDRCECTGECGTDHAAENAALDRELLAIDLSARCSAFQGRPHPVTGSTVQLTLAHMDHDPPAMDETRLRAWCQRCHNRYDEPHRKANAHRTRRGKKALGDLLEAGDG
jgi:hypothetical protein